MPTNDFRVPPKVSYNKPGSTHSNPETGNIGGKKVKKEKANSNNSDLQRASTTPNKSGAQNKNIFERGIDAFVEKGDAFQENVLDPASAAVGKNTGKIFYETKNLFEKLGDLIQKGQKELMHQLDGLGKTLRSIGNKLTAKEGESVEDMKKRLEDTSNGMKKSVKHLNTAKTLAQASAPSPQISNEALKSEVISIEEEFPGTMAEIDAKYGSRLESSADKLANSNPQDDKSFKAAANQVHAEAKTVAPKIAQTATKALQALKNETKKLDEELKANHPEVKNSAPEVPPAPINVPPPPPPPANPKEIFSQSKKTTAVENTPPPPPAPKKPNLPAASLTFLESIENFKKDNLKTPTPQDQTTTPPAKAGEDDWKKYITGRRKATAGGKAAKELTGQRKKGGVIDTPPQSAVAPKPAPQPATPKKAIPVDENGIPLAPPPPPKAFGTTPNITKPIAKKDIQPQVSQGNPFDKVSEMINSKTLPEDTPTDEESDDDDWK